MVENLDTYRQRDAIIQAFSPSVTAAQKVPSLKTGHFHSPTPSDSQQITQIVSGFSVRKTIFAMILALCFIPAPGRAEAASVLQRTTELRTPPVFANCDDPGSGVQRDTHHNKEQAGGLRAAGYASPGNCGEAGPSYRASGRVLLTANAGDAQEGPSAVPPTHIGVNAGETIGWGDLAAPVSIPRYWAVSVVALVGGSALDSASSWGHREANPLLRGPDGRFGARGVGIKSGVVVGLAVVQYVIIRRSGRGAKVFAALNFGLGATYMGVAVRNWRME